MNTTDKYVCNICKFSCKFESSWNKHILTDKHKNNGVYIRPKKNNIKSIKKCSVCDFIGAHNDALKIHYLSKHGTIEEKEKEFTYYCKICDFGSFYENTFKSHCETKKHLLSKSHLENIS
jgi:hypothetical protein